MKVLELPEGARIGRRLRVAREAVSPALSGRELDRLAGKPEKIATQIEADPEANPTVRTLSAYATVLGLTVDWLATGKGDLPTVEQVNAAVAKARATAIQPTA